MTLIEMLMLAISEISFHIYRYLNGLAIMNLAYLANLAYPTIHVPL